MPIILVHPGSFTQGELDNTSVNRLKKGLELYNRLLQKDNSSHDLFFISTIKDKGRDGLSQSELMREWLLVKGVPEDRIITTNQSINTWQDVQFSYQLIDKLGLPRLVYHVSDINHIWPRIWLVAGFWGKVYKIKGKYVTKSLMAPSDSLCEIVAVWRTIKLILKKKN
jgi:uncharacterized SAM-binding protein YcdF (DUF218 family)